MTISSEILKELEIKLYKEKEKLEKELSLLVKPSSSTKHSVSFSEIGSDEDENASEVEEYADNLAIEKSLEKQLKEIGDALIKIKTDAYGKCEHCLADIPIERLLAYPSAKKCLNC